MPEQDYTAGTAVRATVPKYTARGWNLARLRPKSKAAAENDWPNQRPEAADFLDGDNVGILWGEPSGGLVDVDIDDKAAAVTVRAWLPKTGAVFGRDGKPDSHLVYRAIGGIPKSAQFKDPDGPLLGELRSTGLQTMAPPSIHPSGEPVRWSEEGDPAELPAEELAEDAGWAFGAALLVRHWPEWTGQHHLVTLFLAGALLKAGKDQGRVERFVELVCTHGGDDPAEVQTDRLRAVADTAAKIAAGDGENVGGLANLTEIVGRKIARRLRDWCRLREEPKTDPETTDYGNARRLVAAHGDDLIYIERGEGWYLWDGRRYAPDDLRRVEQLAKRVNLGIFDEAKAALAKGDRGRAGALGSWAIRSMNDAGIKATLRSATSEPEIAAAVADLDADPFLLNARNGTVDLRTGGLRPHAKEDLITKICAVDFDPDAPCPLWEAFLLRAMGGDAERVRYLQRVIGYALSGDTREQAIFIFHGEGRDGKTTFVETVLSLLGGYATKVPTQTLVQKKGDETIPSDIAQLPGARFVAANETSAGRELNESLVKDLSGGDTISARHLYRPFFRFKPSHKLILYGNHRPTVVGTDLGIWRRIRLIEFGPSLTDKEDQKDYGRVLLGEGPGILAWAVRGCTEWLSGGLKEPQSVVDATAAYRGEMDLIGGYLDACCERGDRHKEAGAKLYSAYHGWCAENGEAAMTSTAFGNELKRHGIRKEKTNGANWRHGLRLTEEGKKHARFVVEMPDGQTNTMQSGPRGVA